MSDVMARRPLENGKDSERVTVRLAPTMAERLDELADDTGTKRSTLIREALTEYIDRLEVSA